MKLVKHLKANCIWILFVLLSTWSTALLAEACTYKDGILAFEQNNPKRGMALMIMAANDRDLRAEKFLKHMKNNDLSGKQLAQQSIDKKTVIQ